MTSLSGHQRDVGVAARLDQARRYGAHGAVVGGEGLVELRHVSTDSRLSFDEIHLKALIGQIERGLHPGDAAADDHDGADRRFIR